MNIGFLGITHLGLVSMVAFASKGHMVVGHDEDIELILNLKKNSLLIEEPDLLENFEKYRRNIQIADNLKEILKCDVIYISADVKTDKDGRSDITQIIRYIDTLLENLNKNQIMVILCQIPPGFSRKYINRHKNLYYQVETLIFGQALERAIYPERIIIGSEKREINPIYRNLLQTFDCPLVITDFETAELTKIAINLYLANTVNLTNALSEFAVSIGATWQDIKIALQLDKRIGTQAYLNPGLGLSGGNIERDLTTLHSMTLPNSPLHELIELIKANSSHHRDWLLKKTLENLDQEKGKVSLLGVTYKSNTNSLKNSVAMELLQQIKDREIAFYDPSKPDVSADFRHMNSDSLIECLEGSKILIIGTAWDHFLGIEKEIIKAGIVRVIDPFGMLDSTKLTELTSYSSLFSPMEV